MSVEELRAQYGDERMHTDQVARLARVLFDRTHRAMAVAREDRRLLDAACLLHDVGYRLDPPNHAWMSAQLILTRGLQGFTDEQRACVAATVLLHRRKLEYAIATALVRNLPAPERAFRLAAYLRVADGLDHGHIQDVTIGSVRRMGGVFVVNARPVWYQGNVPRAEVKADLWRKVFPIGIELRGSAGDDGHAAFDGVLLPGRSVLENARRLFFALYRTMIDAREAVLLADEPESLHDLRVGVRRFSAGLTFCAPRLVGVPSVSRLESLLARLLDGLGDARDADVWCAFLRRPKVERAMGDAPQWQSFMARECARRERKAKRLRAFLRGKEWGRTAAACGWFVRVLLPQHMREVNDGTPIEAHAAVKLREELGKILKLAHLSERTDDDPKLHALRRAVRRGRYWAEFAQPASDAVFGTLARRLRAVTHALGELHDMYVFTRRLGKSNVEAPDELAAMIAKRRKQWVRVFRREWAALVDPAFQQKIGKRLEGLCKER